MKKFCTYILFLLITVNNFTAHAQNNNDKVVNRDSAGIDSQTLTPIGQILNPDGSINLSAEAIGSFDVSDYEMSYGENGEPIFMAKSQAKAMGDENWSDLFKGPRGADNRIYAITKDVTGNIYVAGQFTSIFGIAANHIAKWDGTTWSALGEGLNSTVYSLASDNNGNIYAAGLFMTAGTVNAKFIAKWNGTTWTNMGSGLNTYAYAVTVDGSGNVYVGGSFTTAGGITVNRIAKWNGSTWSALGSGFDNTVYVIAADASGNIYAGGQYTSTGATLVNNIAKWNGTAWSALGSGMNYPVFTMAFDGSGNLYAGGNFTTAGGISVSQVAKWNGTTWSSLGTGLNNSVKALVVDGSGNVYAGGAFTAAGLTPATFVAKWNGTAWAALETGMNLPVDALAFDGSGNLFAGGNFTVSGRNAVNFISKWNGTAWSVPGSINYKGVNRQINAVAVDGTGKVYVAGDFTTAGGIVGLPGDPSAVYVAKWDGSSWSRFGTGLNDNAYAIAVDGSGNVYVGGRFTNAGGVAANYIAKWNGTAWSALGAGMNNSVRALTVDGSGNVYAGGDFTTAGGITTNYIAKWNGTAWTALGSGMDYFVRAVTIDDSGNLYAGGWFTTAGGIPASYVAKWNGTTWAALGGGVNNQVYALAIDQSGNLYAGGSFIYANGTANTVNKIAKWNGTTWSALGTGLNGIIYALAIDAHGTVFAGGNTSNAGGLAVNNIAKWNGTAWSALGSGTNNTINALCCYDDKLYCGGNFSFAGGKSSSFFGLYNDNYPEINIKGNSVSITDNDNTPDVADHTNFGSVNIGSPITRTFAIENTGTAFLNLTDAIRVNITGASFALTADAPSIIATSRSADFQVTFTPESCGNFTGTVTIANNDENENPYNFTISGTGIDNIPPVTPTLTNITSECAITPSSPTTTDACAGIITGTTTTVFPITAQGTTVVTWTFNDGNGNSVTANQNVIIDDITNPVAPSLANITSECAITVQAPTTTDNCTGTITGTTTDSLTYNTQGTRIIHWTFDDGNGNSITANQNVIVDDVTNPETPILPDITNECAATATIPTTTDACAGTITGTTTDSLTYNTQGTRIIHWTFDDGNGNSITANQNVIVDDVTNPETPILPDITNECAATATIPTTTDVCVGTITGTTTDSLTYNTQGTRIIHWTFDDGNGNSITANQNVIIDDVTNPETPILSDITNECTATATIPTTTDGCAGTIYGTTTDSLTYNTEGTRIIHWTFDDGNGNSITANQNVIIDDVTNPETPILSDITNECAATATIPTTTDGCAGTIYGTTTDSLTYNTQGTRIIHWTFDDGNGNSITANQNVIINDVTNPTIECRENSTVTIPEGGTSYTTLNNEFDPVSYSDNCGAASLVNNFNGLSSLATAIFPIGTTTVLWTVTSNHGETTNCSMNITINSSDLINEFSSKDILISPNPTLGWLNFESGNLLTKSIIITDISGKTIYSANINNNRYTLDLSGFADGLYFAKIYAESSMYVYKILKK